MPLTATGEARLLAAFVGSEGPLSVGLASDRGELNALGYRRQPYGNGAPSFGPALQRPWEVAGIMIFGGDGAALAIEPTGPLKVHPGQSFKVAIDWPVSDGD